MCRKRQQYQIKLFGDAITDDDLNKSRCQFSKLHPLTYLYCDVIDSSNFFECVKYNTIRSVKTIYLNDQKWFLDKKQILLSDDAESANSVLGEIRCYSSMCEAFGVNYVKPLDTEDNKKTPDFKINFESFEIFVEVNTPQLNGDEAKKIEENIIRSDKTKKIFVSEKLVAPFGRVSGSSLRHRVVSKINGIKGKVEQLVKGNLNILWIDLQSMYLMDSCFWINNFSPYYSGRQAGGNTEGIYSNPLWYSCYASKGTPIFDGQTLQKREGNISVLEKMQFSSKFSGRDYEHISAIVFSGADSLVLCENPYAINSLPLSFIKAFSSIPRYKIEHSVISFPNNININTQINESLKSIDSLSKETFYSW